jgi:DNA-binding transcriptional regulator GbsR (MarR family)
MSADVEPAERIRRNLADAWGEMGAAWGVAPAIARVHGYLLSRRAPMTEREVREGLDLSHRAASMALAESEAWGLVERVAEPRRVGRRGPAGAAYVAVGDHWQWFTRVVAQRKLREGDPIVAALDSAVADAKQEAARHPSDEELAALRDWLVRFNEFVRLFDRAIGIVPQLDPRELEHALQLIGRVPDETALRLVRLLVAIPEDDVVPLLDAMSRLSPSGARRATKLIAGVVRTIAR